MGSSSDDDLEAEIDRVYQLPLKSFTEERNALAARLNAQGRQEAAERVKSLVKPPASAWAVNQVYWTARRDFEELIDASDRLRALQARGVTPKELRDAMQERREAVGAALRRAQAALAGQGHAANAAVTQRVATTLESLAAFGSGGPRELQLGRFTEDLSPPGFEALALTPLAEPQSDPARAAKRREADEGADPTAAAEQARAERLQLEKDVAARRRHAQETQAAAEELARRAEGAQRELAEAERRVTKAKERAQEATAAAEKALAAALQAADDLKAAAQALAAAGSPRG